MNNLVLFSGGMDSTIALYHAIQMNGDVYGITIRYGQRHAMETAHADTIWRMAALKYSKVKTLHHIGLPPAAIPRVGSLLTPGADLTFKPVPEGEVDPSFIPHRNLLFITLGAMWARHVKADRIVTGLRGGFSDCNEEFEACVIMALRRSDPSFPIEIYSPVHKSRADSLRMARKIPGCWEALAHSMTCFRGLEPPCMSCLPCIKRAEGFAEIKEIDPLIQRLYDEVPAPKA